MAKYYILFLIALGTLLLAGCANVATETNNTVNTSVIKEGVSNTLRVQDVLVSKDGELKVKLLEIEDNHAVILISGYGFQVLDKYKLAPDSHTVLSVNGTKYDIYYQGVDSNSAEFSIGAADRDADYTYSGIEAVTVQDVGFGSNLIPVDKLVFASIQDVSVRPDGNQVTVWVRSAKGGNLGKISTIVEGHSRYVYSDNGNKYEIAVLRVYKNITGRAEMSITKVEISPKTMTTTPLEFPSFDEGKIKLFFFINDSGEVELSVADSKMSPITKISMREDDTQSFLFENQTYQIRMLEVVASKLATSLEPYVYPEIPYVKYVIEKK